jgi:hypothetical protein
MTRCSLSAGTNERGVVGKQGKHQRGLFRPISADAAISGNPARLRRSRSTLPPMCLSLTTTFTHPRGLSGQRMGCGVNSKDLYLLKTMQIERTSPEQAFEPMTAHGRLCPDHPAAIEMRAPPFATIFINPHITTKARASTWPHDASGRLAGSGGSAHRRAKDKKTWHQTRCLSTPPIPRRLGLWCCATDV